MRPGTHGDQYARPAYSTGSATYRNHLSVQDLERHGLAYICEHPEILFSKADAAESSPAHEVYRGNAAAGYDAVGPDNRTFDGVTPEVADGLLLRVSEAYRILNDIYAPYSARATERRRRDGPAYANSRCRAYWPARPFRKYG